MALWLLACGREAAAEPPVAPVSTAPVLKGKKLDRPVYAVQAPGDRQGIYVVEQAGRVFYFAGLEADASTLVVDIAPKVNTSHSEAGLLGIAFHPRFAENGTLFLSYTTGEEMRSRLSRVARRPGQTSFDTQAEAVVLEQLQPYKNHNGGHVLFGPDGLLYFGLGDGGSGGDPHDHGQNKRTWLGKLLRIDPDGTAPGKAYGIPKDNPYAEGGGAPEIYALGLRNPWRFSFDRQGGALWLADVGQNSWEEIDVVTKGDNLGWRVREGRHCFIPKDCKPAGLVEPVSEYNHERGDISVTGGYVYRGTAIPALAGHYVFGDYASGRIFTIPADKAYHEPRLLRDTDHLIASFAEGHDGELYVVDHRGGLFRLVPGR